MNKTENKKRNERIWKRAHRFSERRTWIRMTGETEVETLRRYCALSWRAGYEACEADVRRLLRTPGKGEGTK